MHSDTKIAITKPGMGFAPVVVAAQADLAREPNAVFPIRTQRGLRPILLLFGVVRPSSAVVTIDGDRLTGRFGFARAETTLSNIERWDITGPYRWWRAVGVRRTIGTHDLSFGGSTHGGVCLHFRSPVRIARLGVIDLYLTVDDLAGLGAALAARGIPGEDLRATA